MLLNVYVLHSLQPKGGDGLAKISLHRSWTFHVSWKIQLESAKSFLPFLLQIKAEEAIKAWAVERKHWSYGVGSTDPGEVVGHYTQIIWDKTLYIGCGMARCSSTRTPLSNIIVCNYAPGYM